MKEYDELALGLTEAVLMAGTADMRTSVETINAAIQREVQAACHELRSSLIKAFNDTPLEELNHSTARILINHVH